MRYRIILPFFMYPVFNDINIYKNRNIGIEGFITYNSIFFEIGSRKHCTSTVINKSAIIITIISKFHKFNPIDTGKNNGKAFKRSIIFIISCFSQ